MTRTQKLGHLAAILTIILWGTTFVSTKILLEAYQPVEILFFRFVMGVIALTIIYPKPLKGTSLRQEMIFAAAGLCGICLYYLLENIALTYTMASNVGVITSIAPCFTAIVAYFAHVDEDAINKKFFFGFLVALSGIFLISFNGAELQLNPVGDILALLAALAWAFYAVITKGIGNYGYNTIVMTRRIFFYGILFMLPSLLFFDCSWSLLPLQEPAYLLNLLFLGLGASALCFVTWNYAVKMIGAIQTSIYIYMVPVITVVTSIIVLDEQITPMSALGILLTLGGLVISQYRGKRKA